MTKPRATKNATPAPLEIETMIISNGTGIQMPLADFFQRFGRGLEIGNIVLMSLGDGNYAPYRIIGSMDGEVFLKYEAWRS